MDYEAKIAELEQRIKKLEKVHEFIERMGDETVVVEHKVEISKRELHDYEW